MKRLQVKWNEIAELFSLQMNIYRIVADLSHLAAINLLIARIWIRRNCTGVSGKTQLLSLMVFVTRYLDLFTNFISPYNTLMKIFFILSTAFIVFSIFIKFRVRTLLKCKKKPLKPVN